MTEVLIPAEELLTADEEIELARRMEAGVLAAEVLSGRRHFPGATETELRLLREEGERARERYVLANVRLVALVANPMARRSGLGVPDLFQEGMSGLLMAVDRFDHTHGVRFATYALPWIRALVARAVANRCGALPISPARAERRRLVRATFQRLSLVQGRDPSAREIAEELGWALSVVLELLALEPPRGLTDQEGSTIDPPDPGAARALEEVVRTRPPVNEWVRRLPPAERRVITLRFGFAGEPASFADVSRQLGVSTSTVRRVELRALERLRDWCSTDALPLAG